MSHPDVPPSDLAPAEPLVARMAAGDEDALRLLYETYGARILRFLHALTGDRQLAEDLTQETFLAAWRAAPTYRPRAPVEHWLFTIARRRGWREGRRRRRRQALPRERASQAPPPETPSPTERAERLDERERLRRAIASLAPRFRLVFVLVRIAGCSYADAARIARLPLGTVKSRMRTAERRLRARLGDEPHP